MKNFILTFFIICNLFAICQSQEFEWVVSPKIQGYDEIRVHDQILKFITVKKDGKYGVISPKNKLILPVDYKSITQVTDDYFSAGHEINDKGRANTFFNEKGKALNFERDVQPKGNQKKRKKDQELNDKTIAGIEKIWPGTTFKPTGVKYGGSDIILANGDTLLKNAILKNSRIISDTYLIYQMSGGKGYAMIDKERKELLRLKRTNNIYEGENGHSIIDEKILVDQNGKIHFDEYEKVNTIYKSNHYKIQVEKGKFLGFDENLEQIFESPSSSIISKKIDEEEFLISTNEQGSVIYSTETKQLIELPFKVKNARGYNHLYSYKKDELIGFYNLRLEQVVLEPLYPVVSPLSEDFFYASPTKVSRKERNKVIERIILDKNGTVVFSKECKSISSLGKKYFKVVNADKSIIILDLQMNEIMTFDQEKKIAFTDLWVSTKENGKKVTYPIENYLNGDLTIWYDAKPTPIKSKDEFVSFYQVSKDEKIGFSDKKGQLLHPCELEEVGKIDGFALEYKGYFAAKKNGKWGILVRPSS